MTKEEILKEVLTATRKANYNAFVILPTGTGKGKYMIEIAKELNPKSILYLCDNRELRDKMFKDELIKWNATYLIPRIQFECYQTACKWQGKSFDLVLGDEADSAITSVYINAFTKNYYKYKILVSATLDVNKRALAKAIAPIIYEKKTGELMEQGVLNKIKVHFVNYNLSGPEEQQYLAYNEQFKSLLAQQPSPWREQKLNEAKIKRKDFLSTLKTSEMVAKWLMNGLRKKGEKILIFCGRATQADTVSTNSYHTENNNVEGFEAFKNGEKKELAVVEKITRGVNIDGVKHIIFETTDSSITKGIQKRGRGLRLPSNEILNVYYLVPHFRHPWHGRIPTVMRDWIDKSLDGIKPVGINTITYNN